jgi:hypothetical protein
MTVLLLAGAPGSGKSTIGARVCAMRSRAACVDVDDIRGLIREPRVAPWEGAEGARQYRLGIANSCLLARSLDEDGCDVVVVDVAPPEVLGLYRKGLDGIAYRTVLLRAEPDVLVRRDARRDKATYDIGLPAGPESWPARIRELAARLDAAAEEYDVSLDTSHRPDQDCAAELAALLDGVARSSATSRRSGSG